MKSRSNTHADDARRAKYRLGGVCAPPVFVSLPLYDGGSSKSSTVVPFTSTTRFSIHDRAFGPDFASMCCSAA